MLVVRFWEGGVGPREPDDQGGGSGSRAVPSAWARDGRSGGKSEMRWSLGMPKKKKYEFR